MALGCVCRSNREEGCVSLKQTCSLLTCSEGGSQPGAPRLRHEPPGGVLGLGERGTCRCWCSDPARRNKVPRVPPGSLFPQQPRHGTRLTCQLSIGVRHQTLQKIPVTKHGAPQIRLTAE